MHLKFTPKKALRTEVGNVVYNAVLSQHDEPAAFRCTDGCKALQRMRGEVVQVSELSMSKPTTQGIQALAEYYKALCFVESRVEILYNSTFQFAWTDSFLDKPHSSSDLTVELSSVLFNMGTAEAGIAAEGLSERTLESVKKALKHYQHAAGYYAKIAESSLLGPDIPKDVSEPGSQLLSQLMLTQAQIAYLEGGKLGNYQPKLLATLAMGVAKILTDALKKAKSPELTDIESQHMLSSLLTIWSNYYTALAHKYRATFCNASADVEDELSHLLFAEQTNYAAAKALKTLKPTNLTSELVSHLNASTLALSNEVAAARDKAEEINNTTFFKTPTTPTPNIMAAQQVKAANVDSFLEGSVMNEVERAFSSLLHKSVINVGKNYMKNAEDLVRDEVAKLDAAGAELSTARNQLQTKQSPRPDKSRQSSGSSLIDDALSSGGVRFLMDRKRDNDASAKQAWDLLNKIESALAQEAAADAAARDETRGALRRPFSSDLNRHYYDACGRVRGELGQATQADASLASRLHGARSALAALEGARTVPEPSTSAPSVECRRLADEANRLLTSMSSLVKRIRDVYNGETTKMSDLPSDVKEREAYFDRRLKTTYDPIKEEVSQLCDQAKEVTRRLYEESNKAADDSNARTSEDNSGGFDSTQQRAAEVWADLRRDLQFGADFYNKELDVLRRVDQDVEGYTAARRAELRDHMEQIRGMFQNMGMNPYQDQQPYEPPHNRRGPY